VQVKENQPELLAMCQMLPQYHQSTGQHVDCDKGHGRIETRTINTFIPPSEWLPDGWQPMVQAVVRIQRVVEHKRKGVPETSIETAWWISTIVLSAEQYQHAIRGHWAVENQNHYVRDVVLFEDACRVREQPGIFARLRSIALNCLRAKDVPSISRAIYRNTLNFNCAVSVAQGRT
jgi:predicted transposase YbfD/YdcC